MKIEIELRPIKGKRGERQIVIGDKAWGRITSHAHGCHGPSYQFLQSRGADKEYWIEREAYKGRWTEVTFRPTKPDRYDRATRGIKAEPLDDQLRKFVAGMIEAGQLRDPDVVAAEWRHNADVSRKAIAAAEAREADEFEERAKACLEPLTLNVAVPDWMKAYVVAKIVEAMRWSQGK